MHAKLMLELVKECEMSRQKFLRFTRLEGAQYARIMRLLTVEVTTSRLLNKSHPARPPFEGVCITSSNRLTLAYKTSLTP